MKPLGFTLDQMRDLLDATDRLDADDALGCDGVPGRGGAPGSGGALGPGEREALLERVRAYERAAAEQVDRPRVQLARAEDFAATLGARLRRSASTGRS